MTLTASDSATTPVAFDVEGDNSASQSISGDAPLPGSPPEEHSASVEAQDTAQALSEKGAHQPDAFAERLRAHEDAQRQRWQAQVNQWRKEVSEDPHMGGANLPASIARAQLALDRFDEGRHIGQLLEQTGYGNNPVVLRFFNRVADALMEDGMVQGQPGSGMPPLEERMYAGWSSRG